MGVLASLGLVVLVALVIVTHWFAHWDLKDPDVTLRLFTFVAACAVLDSRLVSQPVLAQALGVVALVSWLALVVLSVGTSGLAIVGANVARDTPQHRGRAGGGP